MRKYCLIEDIKKTSSELKRAIRWRMLCNAMQEKLAGIIETQINNFCEEIFAQYQLVKTDYEKELLSNTQYKKCIIAFKQLFKDCKYFKYYSKSLMEIKNEIEIKSTINEVKQMG